MEIGQGRDPRGRRDLPPRLATRARGRLRWRRNSWRERLPARPVLAGRLDTRTDEYGGSIENRARFLLEVTQAAASVWGGDRVDVRIAPSGSYGDMYDSNPEKTSGYVAKQMNRFGLAYLHVIEPRIKGSTPIDNGLPPVAAAQMKEIFQGKIIAAGGFEPDGAEAIVEKGEADAVAFGRYFISNPDLTTRIRLGLPLNPYDRATFYGGDAHGYTDYPFYKE